MKNAIIIIAALFFAVFVFMSLPKPGLSVGDNAADFTLKDLNGSDVRLSEFSGKIVFLNFWMPDCMPCREEMPSMQVLNKTIGGENFVMLAVSPYNDLQKLAAFVKERNLGFRILHDPNASVTEKYGVFQFPETFIIDKNGVIIDKYEGAYDWREDEMVDYFRSLIGG